MRFFQTFWFFLLLSTFAVAVPGFAFCSGVGCLRVLSFSCLGGVSAIQPLRFYFVSLFFLKGNIFKPPWRFNLVLFLQLSSQVCVFLPFFVFLSFLRYTFAGDCVKYFLDVFIFLTRWFWVDEGSFDSWGEFNAFFFSISTRMNRHFSPCRYIHTSIHIYTTINVKMRGKPVCVCNKEWGDRNMHLWLTCYFVELARAFFSLRT